MALSTTQTGMHQLAAKKVERLEARVSSAQKKRFQYAADLMGRSLTDFVVSTLQEAANHIIQEQEILQLSMQDRKVFIKALLAPPEPNSRLLQAVKHYEKEVKN